MRFAETTFHALPLDAAEASVPHLAAARDLFAVALSLFGGTFEWIVKHFEKPSNPVFQPAEYRSTNCCAGYSSLSCGPDGPLGYGGGGGAPSFKAIVAEVDQCLRNADADIRAVTPHTIQYDLKGFGKTEWDGEWARFEIRGDRHYTALNIERLEQKALHEDKTHRQVVHEALAHEYLHHIRGNSRHGRLFDSLLDSLKRRTRNCD